MNKKELAKLLNGGQIGEEVSKYQEKIARENGLVIVYGASDDLIEIAGAINDEVGSYDGHTLALFHEGELYSSGCEADDCPHEIAIQEKCKTVKAIFGEGEITWKYETEIPHETFDIYEGDEIFCRGIVFSVEDIK